MEIDHLIHIHAIDVIGAEYHHYSVGIQREQFQTLAHGVGGAFELPALWLDRVDIALARARVPHQAQMILDRAGVVLHQYVDSLESRVDQIGQSEIDDSMLRAERNGRLRLFYRQRCES